MLSFLGYLLVFSAIILTIIYPYLFKKNSDIDKENGKKPHRVTFLILLKIYFDYTYSVLTQTRM